MRVFLLLITITVSSPAVVKWTPNTSFNVPINFRDHKLPCSKQAVVFPDSVEEGVKIQTNIVVKEFVLPNNGELIIEDAILTFGADENDNCTESKTAYYTPRKQSSWADPDVWTSSKYNEATPDAEKVPCYDDEVVFPIGSQFTIALPDITQYIRKLTINGLSYNSVSFLTLVLTSTFEASQNFIRNEYYETGVRVDDTGCTNPIGCPCQKYVLNIKCGIKYCPPPKCFDPIQPIGHCCKICGGNLVIEIGEKFDMLAFEENVADIINSYGKSNLDYHIGLLPRNKVQLVVVDKEEYTGMSSEAVHDIEYKIKSRDLQSVAHFSGVPTAKSGTGAKIAFSMFFLVVSIMGAIYLYYYKTPKLPKFSYPVISSGSRGVLSRFSRRSESVVSLTSRRDSTATLRSVGATAFRNPMYDSKRGRVQVTEAVLEE